jgi:hypothetical protein
MQKEPQNPSVSIVQRLYLSFIDLERAIAGARDTLSLREDVPGHVFKRLDSYDQIIARQRSLANELEHHILEGDMLEISRHVMIINSLSGMIIDDAKQILASISSFDGAGLDEDEGADWAKKLC